MNAIFTGRKRSGKTTLAFDMAMRSGGGIIIFDPKREWRGWPGTVEDVAAIPAKIKEGNEVIIFHPNGDKREAIVPLLEYVHDLHRVALEHGWDKAGYHFTLIIDEAVNVSTARWIDDQTISLVAENRPEILSIFFTFQSPKDANNLLKSRIDSWYIFATSLPSDQEYLNKEIGVPEKDLVQIAELPPHAYAHFEFDGGMPVVEYDYDEDSWYRPLEYFELNAKERDALMARKDEEPSISDLMDYLEENKDHFFDWWKGNNRRSNRDDDPPRRRSERDDDPPRRRESRKTFSLWT